VSKQLAFRPPTAVVAWHSTGADVDQGSQHYEDHEYGVTRCNYIDLKYSGERAVGGN